jgi:GNAT superfamily N-acetyltransferase
MALPADRLEELVGMANRVFRRGGGDMGSEYPLVFDPCAVEGMRVILEDDRVVSHVGVCVRDAVLLGVPLRLASIGAVSTDPDYRGRGFASALMEDTIERAREWGVHLMLISGDRALYRRIGGYRPGGFVDLEIAEAELPQGYALERAGEADIPDLAALYQREPVRFVRSAEDWRKLLAAGMLMNAPGECWLVRDAEDVLGYAVVQRPRSHSGGDSLPFAREYAGSREAVWAGLRALAREYGSSSIRVTIMPQDPDLLGRARRSESLIHTTGFSGTVKIVNVAALVERLKPLWAERIGQEAFNALELQADLESLTFVEEGKQIRLEGPAVAVALFGPEIGKEDEATTIPGIQPLPFFLYGYNYV